MPFHLRLDFDLALIKLDSPVTFNDHVGPACFPQEADNLDEEFDQNSDCVVTGWGTIDPDGQEYGSVLKEDKALLYSIDECKKWDGLTAFTDRMLCAGLEYLFSAKTFCNNYFRTSSDRFGGPLEMSEHWIC